MQNRGNAAERNSLVGILTLSRLLYRQPLPPGIFTTTIYARTFVETIVEDSYHVASAGKRRANDCHGSRNAENQLSFESLLTLPRRALFGSSSLPDQVFISSIYCRGLFLLLPFSFSFIFSRVFIFFGVAPSAPKRRNKIVSHVHGSSPLIRGPRMYIVRVD